MEILAEENFGKLQLCNLRIQHNKSLANVSSAFIANLNASSKLGSKTFVTELDITNCIIFV